jgi:hypothetical protein
VKKLSLSKLRTRHFVWASAAGLGIFLAIAVVFYWFSGWRTDQVIIERLKAQEQSMARSSALSITEFFKARKKELVLLSELEAIQSGREKEGMEILDTLAQGLKEEDAPVGNIIRINKEGVTIWGVNVQLGKQDKAAIGVDVGGRDCFIWAKEKGEKGKVFIGEPMIAQGGFLKGKKIVSMTTPVFYKGKFDGVVVAAFPIDELAKKYIEPLSLSPKTHYTIVSEEGTVITSTFEEIIGKNILQIQKEENWPEDSRQLVKSAMRGEEGTAFHHYVNVFTKRPSEAVSAYSPIKINGSIWSIWVSVPYNEIQKLVLPFRQNQIFALVVVSCGSLILMLVYILGIRVSQRDGFLDGYGRAKGELRKKKKS